MKKGYFITFEGPDGSGKTTVSTAVAKRLQEAGIESIYTREPGGIEIVGTNPKRDSGSRQHGDGQQDGSAALRRGPASTFD